MIVNLSIYFFKNFTQTSPFNYRKGVEDVIFLFTDGEPNAGSKTLTKEQKDMAEQYSKTLKEDKKVKIIGLAVGNDEKVKKFNQTIIDLSSKPGKKNEKYYFQTDLTREDLSNIVDQLVGPLCTPAGKFWYTIVNRIRSLSMFLSGLCKKWSVHRRMCIVFSLNQQIAVTQGS